MEKLLKENIDYSKLVYELKQLAETDYETERKCFDDLCNFDNFSYSGEINKNIIDYITSVIDDEIKKFMDKNNISMEQMKKNGEITHRYTEDNNLLIDIIYKYKNNNFVIPDNKFKYGLYSVRTDGTIIDNVKYKQSLLIKMESKNEYN